MGVLGTQKGWGCQPKGVPPYPLYWDLSREAPQAQSASPGLGWGGRGNSWGIREHARLLAAPLKRRLPSGPGWRGPALCARRWKMGAPGRVKVPPQRRDLSVVSRLKDPGSFFPTARADGFTPCSLLPTLLRTWRFLTAPLPPPPPPPSDTSSTLSSLDPLPAHPAHPYPHFLTASKDLGDVIKSAQDLQRRESSLPPNWVLPTQMARVVSCR